MGGFLDLFRKRKTEPQSRIRPDVRYFVKGEDVIFKLGDADFSFENFYASIKDGSMILEIEKEAPMKLINILSDVDDQVGVRKSQILDGKTTNFTLILKEDIFNRISTRIIESSRIRDVFDIKVGGKMPLRSMASYELHNYSVREKF